MSYSKVKNIHWEDTTLVIELEDGSITQYHHAYIKDIKCEYEPNDTVVSETLPVINYDNNNQVIDWIKKDLIK